MTPTSNVKVAVLGGGDHTLGPLASQRAVLVALDRAIDRELARATAARRRLSTRAAG
jgi:hypothetical protein